jgi:hypothetical protein
MPGSSLPQAATPLSCSALNMDMCPRAPAHQGAAAGPAVSLYAHARPLTRRPRVRAAQAPGSAADGALAEQPRDGDSHRAAARLSEARRRARPAPPDTAVIVSAFHSARPRPTLAAYGGVGGRACGAVTRPLGQGPPRQRCMPLQCNACSLHAAGG